MRHSVWLAPVLLAAAATAAAALAALPALTGPATPTAPPALAAPATPTAPLALATPATPTAPAAPPLASPEPTPQVGRGTLHIYQNGRRATLRVEIAATFAARARGLMFRRSLDEDAGMLFIFEDDTSGGFWMKNTLIPLSIGFIDSRWRLLQILDMDVAPDPANGPFTIYQPSVRYRYALEVNQGYFKRKGITPGARLELITAR